MSQYQRLISYLYRYERGVKKENTGYARIELRGEYCKITVQLQEDMQNISQQPPEVALFIQREWGMERIAAGQMRRSGNGYHCRIETRADNILDMGRTFSDLDGLLLYLNEDFFYATTWKDVLVRLGQTESKEETGQESKAETGQESKAEQETEHKEESLLEAEVELEVAQMEENQIRKEQNIDKNCQHCDCQHCPQKERDVDYGNRILSIFPRMYPFQIENMGECVRLELKDMGYLPVEHWALAGNPFLLHGYYCYRHIVFARLGSKGCHIGVPGIYSKENQKKAEEYGFGQFQSLSEVSDIHGAFGYWFYSLENQSAK